MRKPCKRCDVLFIPETKYTKICLNCWTITRMAIRREEKENDKTKKRPE